MIDRPEQPIVAPVVGGTPEWAVAIAALRRIEAGHPSGDCGCSHDDENCCARVGEWCAVCIAAEALAALVPRPASRSLIAPTVVSLGMFTEVAKLLRGIAERRDIHQQWIVHLEHCAGCDECAAHVVSQVGDVAKHRADVKFYDELTALLAFAPIDAALVPRPEPREPEPQTMTDGGQMETFVDTPLLQAKRRAFDSPTQTNLDALIEVAQAAAVRPASAPSLEHRLSVLLKTGGMEDEDFLYGQVRSLVDLAASAPSLKQERDELWAAILGKRDFTGWTHHGVVMLARAHRDDSACMDDAAEVAEEAASAPSRPLEALIELIEDLQCGSFAERHRPHALDNETCLAIAERLRVLGSDPNK